MRLSEKGLELIQKYRDIYDGKEFYQGEDITSDNENVIFDGYSMYKHLWANIVEETNNLNSFTFLDYGCGRAKHIYARVLPNKMSFHEYFKGRVQSYYCYDPSNQLYMKKPPTSLKFDIIVCADVMEHVAEEDVPYVIQDIASYAHDETKIMFSICGAPAMKSFAEDHENFHVTIKDRNWWKDQIAQHFDLQRTVLQYHK
jgi:hypothetical protein